MQFKIPMHNDIRPGNVQQWRPLQWGRDQLIAEFCGQRAPGYLHYVFDLWIEVRRKKA
jgi:hypothetical protein